MLEFRESSRIERVLIIHNEFIARRALTTHEMADKFGVSQRTIQRDMSAMARVLPIHIDSGMWIYEETAVSISLY